MTVTSWEPLPPLPAPTRLRLRSVLVLYRVRLRQRWLQELLAVAGIAAGVALLYAASVANSSLSGPVRQLNHGITGNSQLQLVGRGAEGFDDSVTRTAQAVAGVHGVAPVLQAPASLVGRHGKRRSLTVYASDPRIVKLRGRLVAGFTATDLAEQEVLAITTKTAEALGLHTGDLARLQIGGRNWVAGIIVLGRRDLGAMADTSMALTSIRYLQKLAGLPHRVSRVLIESEPTRVADVRKALERSAAGRYDVRSAEHEPRLFDKTSQPMRQATMISSVLSSLVGFMFAACAMFVTVGARRALAADLERSGFTTRQIVAIVLLDAVALGVCAVALGLALGELLSRRGYTADVSFLEGAFPLGDARIVTWSSVAIAACGGLLAAAVGVLAPLRGATRSRSSPDARRSIRTRLRPAPSLSNTVRLGGGTLLAGSIFIAFAVPGAALAGLIMLTLSVVLLLPTVFDATLSGIRWLSRRAPRTMLSIELALPQLEARTWRVRSLAIATTGALAVLGAAALQGARSNLQQGLDRVTIAYDHVADVWVLPFGPGDLFGVSPIAARDAARLRAVPGVATVSPFRGGFLDIGGNRAAVRAPAADARIPVPPREILEGSPADATARFRAGGWVTLSKSIADALHAEVGDRVTLPSPVATPLRVAAITTNFGWSGGTVLINADDYARAWGSDAVSAYLLTLAPGVSPNRGRAAVQQAVGGDSPLRVETAAQRDVRAMAASRGGLVRLRQISSLMLVAAVIAMAAAMAGLLWQQRTSVARHKLDGHTTAVMWRTLAVESGVLFGIGCLVGGAASLLGQVLFSRGLQTISGFPVVLSARPDISALSVALVTVVAVVIIAVPGWLVARVAPSLRTND